MKKTLFGTLVFSLILSSLVYAEADADKMRERMEEREKQQQEQVMVENSGQSETSVASAQTSSSSRMTPEEEKEAYAALDRARARIEKEEQEENTIIVLKGENIDELYLLRYNNKAIPVEYNSEYTLNITRKEDDSNIKKELITDKNFEQKHGYNVYYYGVEKVKVLQNGKEVDLKEAISKDNAIIEKIVLKAEKDTGLGIVKNYGMYKDGGTAEYTYDNYNIIKCDRLSEGGNIKDVYITRGDIKYYKIPDKEIKN